MSNRYLNDELLESLEKGNGILSSTPVAKVERDSSGDVTAINFTPGLLDFGSNSTSVRIGALSLRYGLANDYHVSRQGNHSDLLREAKKQLSEY